MKKSYGLWSLVGFASVSLMGTILHFLYAWLGEAAWIAPFSGVNESTWEHMKLLFWPMLLYAVVQNVYFRDRKDFWCIKLRGTLLGLALIPVLFYTYNGAIGKSPDWLNIAIFFLSAAAASLLEARLFLTGDTRCPSFKRFAAVAVLCGIALLFILWTFFPPTLGLFRDPLTGTYGI
jgi:hypothetical protein